MWPCCTPASLLKRGGKHGYTMTETSHTQVGLAGGRQIHWLHRSVPGVSSPYRQVESYYMKNFARQKTECSSSVGTRQGGSSQIPSEMGTTKSRLDKDPWDHRTILSGHEQFLVMAFSKSNAEAHWRRRKFPGSLIYAYWMRP